MPQLKLDSNKVIGTLATLLLSIIVWIASQIMGDIGHLKAEVGSIKTDIAVIHTTLKERDNLSQAPQEPPRHNVFTAMLERLRR